MLCVAILLCLAASFLSFSFTAFGFFIHTDSTESACAQLHFDSFVPVTSICFQELWIPLSRQTTHPDPRLSVSLGLGDDQVLVTRQIKATVENLWLKLDVSPLLHRDEPLAGETSNNATRPGVDAGLRFHVCGEIEAEGDDTHRPPFTVTGWIGESSVEAVDAMPAEPTLRRVRRAMENSVTRERGLPRNITKNTVPGKARSACALYTLHVNVAKDLGLWSVLYPRTVAMNYCKGRCTKRYRPGSSSTYMNTHAEMKARLRRIGSPLAPLVGGSCCVATLMESISILSKTSKGFQSVWYDNFAAHSCMCS